MQQEIFLDVAPSAKARAQCQALGLSTETIRLRVIRAPLAGSAEKAELLVTNLLDNEQYPAAEKASRH